LRRQGNRGHGWAVQNLYPCAGDDDWIAVTVGTDDHWRALVDLMGRPSWTEDHRFATVAGRREGADDINRRLQDWFGGQDLRCAVENLAGAGIPAAPVVSPSLVTENIQLRDRGFFELLDHPRTGPGR
jgi:crotonobetainyl-CoA:carnitine CoA-transferase CaiB-like acyl-CoA transferase